MYDSRNLLCFSWYLLPWFARVFTTSPGKTPLLEPIWAYNPQPGMKVGLWSCILLWLYKRFRVVPPSELHGLSPLARFKLLCDFHIWIQRTDLFAWRSLLWSLRLGKVEAPWCAELLFSISSGPLMLTFLQHILFRFIYPAQQLAIPKFYIPWTAVLFFQHWMYIWFRPWS